MQRPYLQPVLAGELVEDDEVVVELEGRQAQLLQNELDLLAHPAYRRLEQAEATGHRVLGAASCSVS